MSIDLKKDRWFIRINSVEESIAAQQWLFEQGITWSDGSGHPLKEKEVRVLTNYWDNSSQEINLAGFMFSEELYCDKHWNSKYEIKLIFKQKLSVSDVIYPTKESPQQAKIRELEETINKAQEQIKQLKEEV